ncbi:MAG TPA: ATP phosphoribosyltransferase regulatory subunit [Synergistaceae bacterium]|jgi:ATP phosphoribosyltransferase regulatory subunit|nr:MAG: Histidyl-tRNA synthetase 2 [Synergistales bacterium 57_84]KUK88471.1 MAG: Histidyl-tRNA synthetase 2 [Synergistales bacterium 58_81]HBG14054.1 ATP phosphoribosyltransferase regulatory subunit [Synergistaceae bacterium]HCP07740.1 ATP phosphoribosyltransferase regulatory subunit [Synergistaceae bacterium]
MKGLPKGFKSIGGIEAERIERARQVFFELFAGYGYRLLLPSSVQLFGPCWECLSGEVRSRIVSLGTPSGETGCLRPDLTLAAVSYLSSHYAPEERPLRVCYADRVYRIPSPPDNDVEYFQIGAELLGWESEGADIELLTLLLKTLDALDVKENFIVIGDVTILSSLLKEMPESSSLALREALTRRSFSSFREILDRAPIPESLRRPLEELPYLRGGAEVLERATKVLPKNCSTGSVRNLVEALAVSGFKDRVLVDLSIARELDYYSGPVFEVFCGSHGRPVGGGGRYDGLLSSFGVLGQAIGFSLNLDLLLYGDTSSISKPLTVMSWPGDLRPERAMKMAAELAACGVPVEMSWIDQRNRSIELARRRGYRWWTDLSDGSIFDLEKNTLIERADWSPEGGRT